ncbi:MAG: hypothetical protein ACLFVO_21870, partial [Chloroflexaceae bacterium]
MTHAELETLAVRLRQLMDEWGPEAARAAFATQTATLDPQARDWLETRVFGVVGDSITGDKIGGDKVGGDKIVDPQGTLNVGDNARISGPTVGLNLGTIIYGRTPDEDERRRLVWYLSRLANRLNQLPLQGLETRLDQQGAGMALSSVYVMLATHSDVEVARGQWDALQRYFRDDDPEKPLKPEYNPDHALPDQAIVRRGALLIARDDRSDTAQAPPRMLLNAARQRGAALLLFDGLDEVPLQGEPGTRVDRQTTLQAVREFARLHPTTPLLVTCRVRAFADDLRDCLGWPVETLAPFKLGQVRHFVPAWYAELVANDQLSADAAARLTPILVERIAAHRQLREMAQTPLLLTM